jgi:DNA repair protein RecN (Recombination protein N)
MLTHLHIQDLVIVHALALDLSAGMTALTGETGAGKSILIDGLGLALGDKADPAMIRAGCERAEVSAVFDISALPGVQRWLADRELAAGGECILRRVLVREGRSRAFINGSPATQQLLTELGDQLLAIHGQHAHQALLRPAAQRELLDAYAGHQALVGATGSSYQRLRTAEKALSALQEAARDVANRVEFLRFQVGELDELNLAPGELTELEEEQTRLAHAEQLQTDSAALAELLYESDQAIAPALGKAASLLTQLTHLDPRLADGQELLDSARIQVEEAANLLRHYADAVDLDPQRLAQLDARLGRAHDLARKHRVEPDTLPGHHETLRSELNQLEHADQAEGELVAELAAARQAYDKAAAALGKSRRKAAKQLSSTVTESMQTLAMAGGRFDVQVETPDAAQPSSHGSDQIRFEVAANPGQLAGMLNKVASGGELSRISLAIQVATAGCVALPVLIFDEVDVGIGGAVAEIVGQLLRRLGDSHQVLCVTHLPQVAAQAHQHLKVSKQTDGKTTETGISVLNEQERVAEIARMLGGVKITEQTLAHAQEMIAGA